MFGHNSAPAWVRDPLGWIAISRASRDHPLVGHGLNVPPADPSRGSSNRNEAWQDLIMMAAFRPSAVVNRGRETLLDVGQLVGSRTFLAHRWNWSEKTVRWFLRALAADGMITWSNQLHTQFGAEITPKQGPATGPASRPAQGPAKRPPGENACNVITVCNYRDYQHYEGEIEFYLGDIKGQQSGQHKGQHKGHNLTREQDSITKTNSEETVSETPVSDEVAKATRVRKDYPLDFLAFWADYPRTEGTSKASAAKAWARLTADEKVLAVSRLPAFKAYEEGRLKRSPDSTGLHPATYINQKRWETLAEGRKSTARYWWEVPEKLGSVKAPDWEKLVRTWANGTWPIDKLGPPPGSRHCVIPFEVVEGLDLQRYYQSTGLPKAGVTPPWAEEHH